jgi:hypothetical protein
MVGSVLGNVIIKGFPDVYIDASKVVLLIQGACRIDDRTFAEESIFR